MAFADWPLSQGTVNPEGWLKHLAMFLEHGHRLIASLVGVMTLVLFATTFVRNGRNVLELLALVVTLAVMVDLVRRGGAERMEADRKAIYWWASSAVAVLVVSWLVFSWKKRQWSLSCRLSALALLLVTFQALLGGIRVTEISDSFAVVHGCLAQGFFCLLILIILISSPRWSEWKAISGDGARTLLRVGSTFLCSAVFVQLILGALMRHHHRHGLADTGIVLTGGNWLPDSGNAILVIMFLHKYWAFLVTVLTACLAVAVIQRLRRDHIIRRLIIVLALLLGVQIFLGICVIITVKSFWITNFHVINGLLILAMSFVAVVFSWKRDPIVSAGEDKGVLPAAE